MTTGTHPILAHVLRGHTQQVKSRAGFTQLQSTVPSHYTHLQRSFPYPETSVFWGYCPYDRPTLPSGIRAWRDPHGLVIATTQKHFWIGLMDQKKSVCFTGGGDQLPIVNREEQLARPIILNGNGSREMYTQMYTQMYTHMSSYHWAVMTSALHELTVAPVCFSATALRELDSAAVQSWWNAAVHYTGIAERQSLAEETAPQQPEKVRPLQMIVRGAILLIMLPILLIGASVLQSSIGHVLAKLYQCIKPGEWLTSNEIYYKLYGKPAPAKEDYRTLILELTLMIYGRQRILQRVVPTGDQTASLYAINQFALKPERPSRSLFSGVRLLTRRWVQT